MCTINLELTGNEARFLFFAIKNKKTPIAETVRTKLLLSTGKGVLKSEKAKTEQSSRAREEKDNEQ